MSSIYRNGQFYGQTSNPINDAETSLVKTWSSEFIAKFVGDNVDAIVEEIDSLEYSGLAPEIQNNGTVYFITDRGVIYHNGIEYGKPVIEPSQVYTFELTLSSSNWANNLYTIESEFIMEDNYIHLSAAKNITNEQYDALALAKIICTEQADGQIILKALGATPSIDVPITIIIEGGVFENIQNSVILQDKTNGESYQFELNNGELSFVEVV